MLGNFALAWFMIGCIICATLAQLRPRHSASETIWLLMLSFLWPFALLYLLVGVVLIMLENRLRHRTIDTSPRDDVPAG